MDTDRLFESSAKVRHVCDQRHQKPPRAMFHCNQMETDKIDNLLIDIDQLIISVFSTIVVLELNIFYCWPF